MATIFKKRELEGLNFTITQEPVNKQKLTLYGKSNYILQLFPESNNSIIADVYNPKNNTIQVMRLTEQQAKKQIEETIERMKIAISHFQEYLKQERDCVYYWQLDEEE